MLTTKVFITTIVFLKEFVAYYNTTNLGLALHLQSLSRDQKNTCETVYSMDFINSGQLQGKQNKIYAMTQIRLFKIDKTLNENRRYNEYKNKPQTTIYIFKRQMDQIQSPLLNLRPISENICGILSR